MHAKFAILDNVRVNPPCSTGKGRLDVNPDGESGVQDVFLVLSVAQSTVIEIFGLSASTVEALQRM